MLNNPMGVLSQMTNLPQAELSKAVQNLKDPKTGTISGLRQLDAALAAAGTGSAPTAAEAYTPAGSRSQTSHVIEDPAAAFTRTHVPTGYAPGEDMGRVPSVAAFLEKTSDAGVKRAQSAGVTNMDAVAAGFQRMMQTTKQKIQDASGKGKPQDEMSKQLQFEQIKMQMQKISEIQDMLSNVLKMMNEQAMTAIRNAKA